MGEFHYTRVPPQSWEEEILKMKAGGIQVIATYVFWIHHEEVEGRFDWSGRRDLRHFIQLCAKHGMLVQLRIGPWDHGEVRNGGFPDWVLKKVPEADLRRDTPVYMDYVSRLYSQIGLQAKGLLWKDGGPVIGIQLENEYAGRGPGAGDEYIMALKRLAIRSGFDVPLYIVTGWDNAAVPKGEVLPVFGGYMDAPWDGSIRQLPPSEVYNFRFGSRVTGSMGMMGRGKDGKEPSSPLSGEDTPFLTAEMGGAVQDTYHRRPVIDPDDVAAMVPVMLGSGVNLYGSYMFQGGDNPDGILTTLQESQDSGYPNDLPVKSYDFQGPLGTFGQERESFRRLKLFNYFMEDFGSHLAPLAPRPPLMRPSGPGDLSVPRYAVRTNGENGFLFVNNHVRHYPMPSWSGVRFTVKLPGGDLSFPRRPVTLASGAYFIWPFNMDLGYARLRYASAQLFTRLAEPKGETLFFVQTPGIDPEFAFDKTQDHAISAPGGRIESDGGLSIVVGLKAGPVPAVVLGAPGREVRIVLLSREEAESAWKVVIEGRERLLFTSQQFYADKGHVYLQSIGGNRFAFRIYPGIPGSLRGDRPIRTEEESGGLSRFSAAVPADAPRLDAAQIQEAGGAQPVRLGPPVSWRKNRVAQAPPETAFAAAAKWRVAVSPGTYRDIHELFLEVNYTGDVARLTSGGRLLEDDFFNGIPWQVGLERFRSELMAGPLTLEILPLRKDAPVFIEGRLRPDFGTSGQLAVLHSLRLVPEFELVVQTTDP
jgi:hypothetical protein